MDAEGIVFPSFSIYYLRPDPSLHRSIRISRLYDQHAVTCRPTSGCYRSNGSPNAVPLSIGYEAIHGGGSMKGAWACIGAVMRAKLAALMAYRSHFFLSVILLIAGDLLVPMITLLVYRSGASFPGWSLHEALLIQGVFGLAKGIAFPL